MNKDIYRIMRDAYKEYGDEVFLDNKRLHAYLQDLLAAYPAELKRITLAINENIFSKVITELNEDNKSRLNLYSAILIDNYSMQTTVAEEIVDLIYATVYGETSSSSPSSVDGETKFKNELVNQLIAIGDLMFTKGLLEEAYSQYLETAKNNNSAAAQWRVAECLNNGWGAVIDEKLAMKFYSMSAEQGYPMAQHFVATNTSPIEDEIKHFKTIERLALQYELPAAYCTLGELYAKGIGCKQDFSKYGEFTKVAAEKNYYWAMYSLESMYRMGVGVEYSEEKAQEWKEKHEKISNSFKHTFLEHIRNEFQ